MSQMFTKITNATFYTCHCFCSCFRYILNYQNFKCLKQWLCPHTLQYCKVISIGTSFNSYSSIYKVFQKAMRLIFYLPKFLFFKYQCYPLRNSSLGQLNTDRDVVPTFGSSAGSLQLVWSSACLLKSKKQVFLPSWQKRQWARFL